MSAAANGPLSTGRALKECRKRVSACLPKVLSYGEVQLLVRNEARNKSEAESC